MGKIVETDENFIVQLERKIDQDLGEEALTRFYAAMWSLYRWEWAGEHGRTITHVGYDSAPYSLFFSHEDTKHPDLTPMIGGLIYDPNDGLWSRHT